MFIFLGKGKAETYERHCSRSLLITTEVSEETDERKSFIKLKLTSFALPTVEQVRDRHSEPLGLFFAGKIQTDLTGLEMKRERSHWYHWHFWKASDEFTRVKNVTEVTLWLICKHQWNVCVKMKVFPTGTVTNLGEIIGNKEFWRQQEPLKRNVVQMRTSPQGKKLFNKYISLFTFISEKTSAFKPRTSRTLRLLHSSKKGSGKTHCSRLRTSPANEMK